MPARLGERKNRRAIEVIVVIVRQDDGVERRQRLEWGRRRVKALRTSESHGRDAIAPHGVRQNAYTVDLDDERRVPEPGDAEAGRRTRTPPVSYTHLRAHETPEHLVCRLL